MEGIGRIRKDWNIERIDKESRLTEKGIGKSEVNDDFYQPTSVLVGKHKYGLPSCFLSNSFKIVLSIGLDFKHSARVGLGLSVLLHLTVGRILRKQKEYE